MMTHFQVRTRCCGKKIIEMQITKRFETISLINLDGSIYSSDEDTWTVPMDDEIKYSCKGCGNEIATSSTLSSAIGTKLLVPNNLNTEEPDEDDENDNVEDEDNDTEEDNQ